MAGAAVSGLERCGIADGAAIRLVVDVVEGEAAGGSTASTGEWAPASLDELGEAASEACPSPGGTGRVTTVSAGEASAELAPSAAAAVGLAGGAASAVGKEAEAPADDVPRGRAGGRAPCGAANVHRVAPEGDRTRPGAGVVARR